jgi:hypothetical protein
MTNKGVARITIDLERTWVGSDEEIAKSIAKDCLGNQGFKVVHVEVGLSEKDAKLIAILQAINRVMKRNISDSTSTLPIIDEMITQLKHTMKTVD